MPEDQQDLVFRMKIIGAVRILFGCAFLSASIFLLTVCAVTLAGLKIKEYYNRKKPEETYIDIIKLAAKESVNLTDGIPYIIIAFTMLLMSSYTVHEGTMSFFGAIRAIIATISVPFIATTCILEGCYNMIRETDSPALKKMKFMINFSTSDIPAGLTIMEKAEMIIGKLKHSYGLVKELSKEIQKNS